MLFFIQCQDRENVTDLRRAHMDAHKRYVAGISESIAFAGPLMDSDTRAVSGSLIVADFESAEAVHTWLEREPFTCAGVYASTTIRVFANRWPQRTGFPVPAEAQ